MQMILMTVAQADALRVESEGIHRIDPRPIDAGPYAGQCAAPATLLTDARYAEYHDALAGFAVVDVDIAVAWPPVED